MEIEYFDCSTEAFKFSKLYEDEINHDKRKFKRVLSVAFEVRNASNYLKNWLQIMQAYFFCG